MLAKLATTAAALLTWAYAGQEAQAAPFAAETTILDFCGGSDAGCAGLTKILAIEGVPTPTGPGLLTLTLFGDFANPFTETVDVSVEGVSLGRLLDLMPANDAFDNAAFDDLGNDYLFEIVTSATLDLATLAAIAADGRIEVSLGLGAGVGDLSGMFPRQEFLRAAISYEALATEIPEPALALLVLLALPAVARRRS